MNDISFSIEKKLKGKLGRAGVLRTAHGEIKTPAFVAVGTKATVKAITPEQFKELGAQAVLANAYHLYLQPGETVIEKAGGLGKFMGWDGPTMTDSGGFQAFSLGAAFGLKQSKVGLFGRSGARADDLNNRTSNITTHTKHTNKPENVGILQEARSLVHIDNDGVSFTSPKDGSRHRFTPERSIEIQHAIGADIIFAFDECTSPYAAKNYQLEALDRTHRWAERSLAHHLEVKPPKGRRQALFGIVQGGRHKDLRQQSARIIGAMDFDGFGIGGSFDKKDIGTAVHWVNELLPPERPRHLLGIGEISDLFSAVENGCDLFDCVLPTRLARHGTLMTRYGRINILNSRYRQDFAPLDRTCHCSTCTNYSRAYLAHLFRAKEILANTLATIHNLNFIISLVEGMRGGILANHFQRYKEEFFRHYRA